MGIITMKSFKRLNNKAVAAEMQAKIKRAKTTLTGITAFLVLLTLGALFWQQTAFSQQATVEAVEQATLEAVDVGALPGGQIQLRFRLSQPVPEPRNFTVNQPARIVLDFVNTSNGLSSNQQDIGQGVAERVVILEGADRTRASINLSRLVPYTLRSEGNSVILTLGDSGGQRSSAAAAASSAPGPRQQAGSKAPVVGDIDFRRGVEGEAIINITMSSASVTVNVRDEGNRIVAEFIGMRLPRGQERRLDVTDFATPVTLIDALNQEGSAEVSIFRLPDTEFLAFQTGAVYTIEVRPIVEPEPDPDDPTQRVFTGEPLSLNFQDIEVRAVLQIIADFTGLNVVVSDTVQGNLTLRLQNVPWDQALDIILRTKGLTQRQNGNVIYIAPTEEISAREKLELEARSQREALIPLRTDIIQVNYAKAEDMKSLIEARSGGDDDTNLLSSRGQITADPRTNTLLVQDIPVKIAEMRDLIERLDIPVRQVTVDTRIIIANDDFSRQLGIRWGGAYVNQNGDQLTSLAGSLAGTDTIGQSAIDNIIATGQPFPVEPPELADRLGVNLGVGNPFGSLALAILGQDYLIDLELSALQAEGAGEVISNPKIITTDRQKANIKQGTEVPFITLDDAGNAITEFREAVLELTVTPQITPDGSVIMDLEIKKDEPGAIINGQTSINKREIKTQALVKNGETVVLGGVFEKVSRNSVDKVPFLGDIPAVGRLFRRNINQDSKLELLIFVTPQVVAEGITLR